MSDADPVVTIYGCELRVVPGEVFPHLPQPGSMLVARMQHEDLRRVEIYLSETDRRALIELLENAAP
jgi:hypothetical protein